MVYIPVRIFYTHLGRIMVRSQCSLTLKEQNVWPFWWFSKAVGLKFHTIWANDNWLIQFRPHLAVRLQHLWASRSLYISRKSGLSGPNFSSFMFPKRSAKPEWNQQWNRCLHQLKESRSGALFLLPMGFELHQSEKPCRFKLCSPRLRAVKRSHFLVW